MIRRLALAACALPLLLPPAWAQKVSTMPPASIPLSGAELLYCVQSGQSRKCLAGDIASLVNSQLPLLMASKFGMDPTGANDATVAINNCLTAAKAGGTCLIDPGSTVKIAGTVSIPAYTTLGCLGRYTLPDESGGSASLNTLPSIRLVAGVGTIQASGEGATFRGCLVLPFSMTFPQGGDSSWTGTAISSNSQQIFTVDDTVVVGFDTCVNGFGTSRLRVHRLMYDCKGASLAAFYAGNNVDSGELADIKGQPIATNNTCSAASLRHGIGFELNNDGGEFLDNIVVQTYTTGQYLFNNSNAVMVGRMWADGPASSCLGFSAYGLKIVTGNDIKIDHLDLNGTGGPGIVITQATLSNNSVTIGDIFFNVVGGDCLQAGSASAVGGVIRIGNFNVSGTGCAGYAVNVLDLSTTTQIHIDHAYLEQIHGHAAPYFNAPNTNSRYGWGKTLYINNLEHDLAAGANLFNNQWFMESGSDGIDSIMSPTLGTCTGLGTGSCALSVTSNVSAGAVVLSPTGSPSASGAATVNVPVGAGEFNICALNLQGGSGAWPVTSTVQMGAVSQTQFQFQWATNGAALAAGSTYGITYVCRQI